MNMSKYFKILYSISLVTISIIIGLYIKEQEVESLKKSLKTVVNTYDRSERSRAQFNVDILHALKEGKIELIENVLIADLSSLLRYANEYKLKERVGSMPSVYDKAISYQSKYCQSSCLGIIEESDNN